MLLCSSFHCSIHNSGLRLTFICCMLKRCCIFILQSLLVCWHCLFAGIVSTIVQDTPHKIFIGCIPNYLNEDQVSVGNIDRVTVYCLCSITAARMSCSVCILAFSWHRISFLDLTSSSTCLGTPNLFQMKFINVVYLW